MHRVTRENLLSLGSEPQQRGHLSIFTNVYGYRSDMPSGSDCSRTKKSQLSVGSQRATGAGSEDQLVQPAPLVTSGEVAGDRRFTGRHDRAGFPAAPTAPTSRYVAEKLSEFALMPRASPRVTHLADEAHLFHPLASAALGVYFGAGEETKTRGQPCSATRAAAVTPCRGLPAMGQPPAALPAPRQPALGKGGRWSGSPHMPPAPEGWTLERGQVWVPAC